MTDALHSRDRDIDLPDTLPHAPCVHAATRMVLDARQPPWQRSGIRLARGQAYSVFARGRIDWANGVPDLHAGPRFHLWCRVSPGGRIRNLREETDSFEADVDGELELGLYMGMWRDAYGELATDAALYARLSGALEVLVVAWQGSALDGLDALTRTPGDCYATEAIHLRTPVAVPEGWQHLVEIGETHLFSAAHNDEGAPAIRISGEDDQGILCRPCDIPLSPDTRLRWRWRLHELPSAVAENSVRAHDYISIAAEFDNGRDLTWFWSTCLAPDAHFDCPVRYWSARETHFVVRSGRAGLGHWQREERPVWEDVAHAMGPPPGRIVRVWLIAVASFQHGRLRAEFSDIEISDGQQRWSLL